MNIEPRPEIAHRLNELLAETGLQGLDPSLALQFARYLDLLLQWNQRVNLTAIRDEEGILRRHFLESITCARMLPTGIATLLDLGSGAGFPGIPIALCRPEIAVSVAESQGKKAGFLREAVRQLCLSVQVHAARAETISGHFDCVVMRAVDRMEEAVPIAAGLVQPDGWLAIMTTGDEAIRIGAKAGPAVEWSPAAHFPHSANQILLMGRKVARR